MKKTFTGFKFDPDLNEWLKGYAEAHGTSKTAVVESLLYALREDRIRVVNRAGPNAFPGGGEVAAGDTPEYPVLVAPSSRDQVGPPGWDIKEIEGVGIFNTKSCPCGEVLLTDSDDPNKPGGKS